MYKNLERKSEPVSFLRPTVCTVLGVIEREKEMLLQVIQHKDGCGEPLILECDHSKERLAGVIYGAGSIR